MTRPKTTTTLLLFFFLVLFTVLLGEMATYLLKLNQLIYKDLSEQLTLRQIEKIFETKTRWAWAGYVVLPFLFFVKITVIAWVLAIGGFFKELPLSHGRYFRIVLLAEFVFLIPAILKIVWFYFFETDFTLEQIQQFVPFSLQSVIDTSDFPNWALYPLQIINLFEVAYWVLLAFLIDRAAKTYKGMKVVLTGYGPALFIWIVFIMFLTLNITI